MKNRLNIIPLFFVFIALSACENSNVKKEDDGVEQIEEGNSIRLTVADPAHDEVSDTTNQEVQELKEEQTIQKTEIISAPDTPEVETPVERNYYGSEHDDPNYVGTPCKYRDGECYTHNHKRP